MKRTQIEELVLLEQAGLWKGDLKNFTAVEVVKVQGGIELWGQHPINPDGQVQIGKASSIYEVRAVLDYCTPLPERFYFQLLNDFEGIWLPAETPEWVLTQRALRRAPRVHAGGSDHVAGSTIPIPCMTQPGDVHEVPRSAVEQMLVAAVATGVLDRMFTPSDQPSFSDA